MRNIELERAMIGATNLLKQRQTTLKSKLKKMKEKNDLNQTMTISINEKLIVEHVTPHTRGGELLGFEKQ